MKQFKTIKQILIPAIIIAIVSIIIYILFFNNIKEKNKEISIITNEIDIAIQKEIELKSIKNLIADTEDDREQLETYLIADDKIADFIEEIENLGRYAGADIEIMSVSISDNKYEGKVQDTVSELLHLEFKADGKWSSVFRFFALMEKLPFKINISRANLEVIYKDANKRISSGNWRGFFSITVVKSK